MSEKKESIRYADLPLISGLPAKQFMRAKELMVELEKLDDRIKVGDKLVRRSVRIDQLKTELEEIQENCGVEGMRYGKLAFASVEYPGNSKFSREKAIEAGIKVSILNKCYETGEAYRKKFFKILD